MCFILLDFKDEFALTKNLTKKISENYKENDELLEQRNEYFSDVCSLVNNHVNDIREIEGLEGFINITTDAIYDGTFQANFEEGNRPSTKGLTYIEEITGTTLMNIYGEEKITCIFALEKFPRHRVY